MNIHIYIYVVIELFLGYATLGDYMGISIAIHDIVGTLAPFVMGLWGQ